MKKLLFLTNSYPIEYGSASVLCTHRVMDVVRKNDNFEVHVLCFKYPKECSEEIINNIHVHRVNPSLWIQWINSFFVKNKCSKLLDLLSKIQRVAVFPWYPLQMPFSLKLLNCYAKNLNNKEKFDIVISEHHGIETFICGCRMMKDNNGLRHIAILWDPIKGQTITQYLPKSFIEHKIMRLEKLSMEYTTMIVSTGTMRDYYNRHHDIAKDKRQYLGFPGVIRPSEEVTTDKLTLIKEGYINVVYSGQLSPLQRDPIPVIELFNRCQFAEKINLIFFAIGNVEDDIKKIKFKGQFSYNGYIPLQELHTIYRHADYLLNISHTNPNMVPSKIFEYMSYGKPIISTFVTDGDAAAKTLANYPEALVVDLKKNDEANLQNLNLFLSKKHEFVDFEEVKHNFKENTPEAYLELIESVLN